MKRFCISSCNLRKIRILRTVEIEECSMGYILYDNDKPYTYQLHNEEQHTETFKLWKQLYELERIQQRQKYTTNRLALQCEVWYEVTSRTYGVQRSKEEWMSSFISLINRYDYQRSSKQKSYSLSKSKRWWQLSLHRESARLLDKMWRYGNILALLNAVDYKTVEREEEDCKDCILTWDEKSIKQDIS